MNMITLPALTAALCACACCAALAADAPAAVVRTPLLTAPFAGQPGPQRVEVKRIELPANQRTPRHKHPCPVVSYVVSGTILFQIEGQAAQRLPAGSAVFEPADAVVTHFDAVDGPAVFIADYLPRDDQHELTELLN